MEEQPKPDDFEPSMGAFEGNLFGTLMQVHLRLIKLVRQSPLDEDAKIKVYERVMSLMDEFDNNIKTAFADPQGFDFKGHFESIHAEAEKMIDELVGGKQPGENPDEAG